MSHHIGSKDVNIPFRPSYPDPGSHLDFGHDIVADLEKIPGRRKDKQHQHHRLFQAKENTVLGVVGEEVTDRGVLQDRILTIESNKERERRNRHANQEGGPAGFWIFGAGYQHELGEEFTNPDNYSQFIIKILSLRLACVLLRVLGLSLIILHKPFHDVFFAHVVSPIPMGITSLIHAVFLIIAHNQSMLLYIRKHHFHAILFFLSEIVLAIQMCFFSLLLEYGALEWFSSLDTFHDYDENDVNDRRHWTQVKLTPPVFLIIFDIQITVNVLATLLLQSFTPIHVGAHELYRIMVWLTLLTILTTYIVILTNTYGDLPIWDGFQAVLGALAGLGKSWIFAYKITRLMAGKMIPIESLQWNDVFYAAYVSF